MGTLATIEELEQFHGFYHEPPTGFHWEWSAEDPLDWRLLLPSEERNCRYGAGGGAKGCGRQAMAELRRRTAGWYYCEQHLYGRRIKDGRVEIAKMVRDAD